MKMDIPVHIGFSILQLAKLRMLEFYYDFMDRYFDRKDFQYVAMDTDSAYMALSAPMDNIVRKEIADIYYKEYGKWFPRMYCDRHADDFQLCKSVPTKLWELQNCCKEVYQYDIRTPGLFKVEFSGHGIVALNSKTYFCWNDETHSTKHSDSKFSERQVIKDWGRPVMVRADRCQQRYAAEKDRIMEGSSRIGLETAINGKERRECVLHKP
ncbi:uncharacterized protein [Watersipora subatra]|uniref:uncharacterized protein n=1 Tax=Watersipora subatra TaxID=2589382 RepID=UPI00355B8C96